MRSAGGVALRHRHLALLWLWVAGATEESQWQYFCLEAVNQSVLNNIVEIKENAQRLFLEREHPDIAALDDRQNLNNSGGGGDDGPQLNQA